MEVQPVRAGVIELRPWAQADAQWYVDARDDEVFRFTTEVRELSAEHVARAIQRVADSPTEAAFAIWTADGQLVGNLALRVDGTEAEVSYFVCAEGRGHGYATAAVAAATQWAFGHLEVSRLVARVAEGNTPSVRVLQANGFVLTGTGFHQVLGPISYWALPRPRPVARDPQG